MANPRTFETAKRPTGWVPAFFILLATGGAVMLSVVSILLNFNYAQAQGETAFNGWLYGLAMAGGDALKCALPCLFAVAIACRQWLAAAAMVPLFLLLTAFSLQAAIGFAAENRGGRIDSREGAAARYAVTKAAHDQSLARRADLGSHRPRTEIEAALQALLVAVPEGGSASVAKLSADCSRPGTITRNACSTILVVRGELARAIEAERLASDIERYRLELDRLIAAGALRESDSQASAIAKMLTRFGADEKFVRSSLSWLMAIVIEAGSSLGLYVASVAVRRDVRIVEAEVIEPAASDRLSEPTPPSLPAPPAIPVISWWFARLHVASGSGLTFHEAFDDYQAFAVSSGQSPLDYGAFRQEFDVIAGSVQVVVIGSQIQNVRLGAA